MSPTILIVEDEADVALMLRYNLEAEGFRVQTAATGDEAVERMREGVPDLILLDWMLPGLSGIELCRRWRAREETARVPIIMITARGEEEERIRGLSGLRKGQTRIEATVRRSNGRWVALEVERSGGGGRHGGDDDD